MPKCSLITRLRELLGRKRKGKELSIVLLSSKQQGKMPIETKPRRMAAHVVRKVIWQHGADGSKLPMFEAIGVTLIDGRVVFVKPGSPASRAGLCPFDRILEVDGVPLDQQQMLDEVCQYLQKPVLRLERPPKMRWAELLDEIYSSTSSDSRAWVEAVLGAVCGDKAAVLEAVQAMLLVGHNTPLLQRRVCSTEAKLISLGQLVKGMDERIMATEGALLIELAIDQGHTELAQVLLAMFDEKEVAPAAGGKASSGGARVVSSSGSSGGSRGCSSGAGSS